MNKKEKVSLGLVGASLLVAVGILAPRLGTIAAPSGEMVLYPTAGAQDPFAWVDNAGPFEESARTQVTPEDLRPAPGAERR